MKPNFALNLSHEGIALLHRSKTGWLRVGNVALDDPDLGAALKLLRSTAADLENGGLTTKLVIPNSQILYTEIDAPGPDTAARISQIRDGLVGLTPYDVGDLVFDWRMDGPRAQVAVVARDTLREAENFATEYRFNPVSFVAVPVDGEFAGEPYFGPTRHAASLLIDGEAIEPDSQQIQILGTASPGSETTATEPASGDTDAPDDGDGPTPEVPTGDFASGAPAVSARKPKTDSVPEEAEGVPAVDANVAKTDPLRDPTDAIKALAPAVRDETPQADPPPDSTAEAMAPGPDLAALAVTFTSRRAAAPLEASGPAPAGPEPRISLGGAPTASAVSPLAESTASSAITAATLDIEPPARPNGATPGGPGPSFRPASGKPPRPATPTPDRPVAAISSAAAATAPADGPDRTPMPMTAAHTADVLDPREKAAERRRLARRKAKDAGAALLGTFSKLGRGTAEGARRLRPRSETFPSAASEAEAMTVFGARGKSLQRHPPKYLGLMLTLLLLLALAVLALWSTYFMNDVTSGLFGSFDEDPVIAAPEPVQQPQPFDPAPLDTSAGALPPPEPSTDTVEPAIAAQPDPAPTDASQPNAPQVPIATAPQTASSDPLPLAPPDSDAEPTLLALLQDPVTPDSAPAAPTVVPVVPEPIISAPARQPPPSPAEAEARYAATGIWQLDPAPLLDVPGGGDRLEDIYVASIDPAIAGGDAVALPGAAGLATDQRPPSLNPPAPLGTRFDMDDRGLVRATPEGAVSREGVPVFSGAPPVVPGPRPASLNVPLDETRVIQDIRLQGIRPALRPAGLEVANERARLGGFSSLELAAVRPAVRPLSLQEQRGSLFDQTATGPSLDNSGVADTGATELAVTVSLAPATRPSNFSSLVERALLEAADSDTEAEPEPETLTTAAVAAPRMPSVPTRASVAKQATVENAINLGKVNLIGIYGSPSQRRALVRLSSGKYVKVQVGDRVDGGRVAAIGDGELRYVKGGRNITLKMPKG